MPAARAHSGIGQCLALGSGQRTAGRAPHSTSAAAAAAAAPPESLLSRYQEDNKQGGRAAIGSEAPPAREQLPMATVRPSSALYRHTLISLAKESASRNAADSGEPAAETPNSADKRRFSFKLTRLDRSYSCEASASISHTEWGAFRRPPSWPTGRRRSREARPGLIVGNRRLAAALVGRKRSGRRRRHERLWARSICENDHRSHTSPATWSKLKRPEWRRIELLD